MRRIVTITKNRINPAHDGARIGITRLASTLGVAVEHFVPEVPDSIEEQVGFLVRMVEERPDAIILAPAHATALDEALDRVVAAGIPVMMIVGRTRPDHYRTFVGSDDYDMSHRLAHALCSNLAERSRLAILDGNPTSTTYGDRYRGFRDGAADFPAIKVVAARNGDYLTGPAYAAMNAILDCDPRIDGILIANDCMAVGALQAVRERRVPAKIASANATPAGIAAIETGEIVAIGAFDPFAMACIAFRAAVRHLDGEPAPKEIVLPADIVTVANAAAWRLPYSERPLPDWREDEPGRG